MVSIPPQALRRVMTNLIDNGLKFGTTVTVTLTRDAAGDVTLHVLDEGPGIPEAALQAVLKPFYRLEDSRNRDTGGTGLGLAIAAQLVSQMNGALRLANRPQGGLVSAFALPRRDCILLYLRRRRIIKPTILPLSRHIRLTWPCGNVVAATPGSDDIMRRRRCRYSLHFWAEC